MGARKTGMAGLSPPPFSPFLVFLQFPASDFRLQNPSCMKQHLSYALLALFCLIVSLLVGWSSYAARINHDFYDLYFRQRGPRRPYGLVEIVAIDDATLGRYGRLPLSRSLLARAIRVIRDAQPIVIAIDLLLADVSTAEADRDLEEALAGFPPPILATALEARTGDHWLDPLPQFAGAAGAVGHVHADPDPDGVSRQVLLEKRAGRQRYWALALECLRMEHLYQTPLITETEDALEIPRTGNLGTYTLPARRTDGRAMLINYVGREGTFPEISLTRVLEGPALGDELHGKIVILGVTAQGTGDRLFTPFSDGAGMPGAEIHANILDTLLTREFLRPADDLSVALAVVAIAAMTALALASMHGISLAVTLIGIAAAILTGPYWLFLKGQVWPAFSLLLPFGLTLSLCGPFQLLTARRKFAESEARRRRSQQQFEMATHELRTPLTAIQASSELLSRYPLDEARRQQMVRLIYEESRRLGKLVERFLSVERLSAGEMELRRVPVNLASLFTATIERLRPAAERKGIQLIRDDSIAEMEIEADPELLEFAISNLLTNAVKYSPPGTSVRLALERVGRQVQIHVSDSGSGMTAQESRRVFDRFFRTESARRSEAPGFGLGLAIAREIARHHGGDLTLQTKQGVGSRFTISLPAGVAHVKQASQ